MSFYSSKYRLFLLLGNPHREMLWNYSGWSTVEQHFSGLLVSTRGPARVRSNQIDLSAKKSVSFGRMYWDSKSHDKWLHGSPRNSGTSDSWLFSSFEAWMPSWIDCEREDKSPDVFLHIVNEESTRAFQQTPMFNPTVLVAISEELFRPELVTHIREIQRKTESRLFTIDNRPWGISSGAGFSDSIQDLLLLGTFRPGPVHDGKSIEEKLRPEWKEY